jgi:hypothetical protein
MHILDFFGSLGALPFDPNEHCPARRVVAAKHCGPVHRPVRDCGRVALDFFVGVTRPRRGSGAALARVWR